MSRPSVRHLMVDFLQMKAFEEHPIVLDRGAGIRLWDDGGREYIDGLSGTFTSNLGHGNEAIVEAVSAQVARLAFGAPTMATTTAALRLVERLLTILPKGYTTMKFLSGGSEAVESALKIARQYHKQTGNPGKYKIVSHYRGYHGGTGHALAATGWAHWKAPYEPLAPGFLHLLPPDPLRAPASVSSPDEAARLYADVARDTIELEGPETIAAVITEPIMLSAGVVVPPALYLQELRELCDRHDILLIYDEMITGFGRTGTWFGAEHAGAWPDILCCGKGMSAGYSPLSAVFMVDRVARAFWGAAEDGVQFHSGHTYGGNPVACAAGLATIDYIERHGILAKAAANGARLGERLRELAAKHTFIRTVRGIGMMQALILGSPQGSDVSGSAISREARSRGLLLRASSEFVAVAPPLIATRSDIDEIVAIIDDALTSLCGSTTVGREIATAAAKVTGS